MEWGDDFLSRINGVFALVLMDRLRNRLMLARDRIGERSLCYYWDDHTLVFASELKPIMQFPMFKRKVNTQYISEFLCRKYINYPNTIFENVYKLAPGSYAVWSNGRMSVNKYWDLAANYKEISKDVIESFDDARSGLKKLLYDSIRQRMPADVPVGFFLSGGIDSTLVSAIASKICNEQIQTFTIGFEHPKVNEADRAKKIAAHLGARHTELYISDSDLLGLLHDIPQYFDEPFADSSQIPTMLACSLAAQNVKVVLSGDGGDEVFCGYRKYELVKYAQRLDFLAEIVNPVLTATHTEKHLPNNMRAFLHNRDKGLKTQLGPGIREAITRNLVLGESHSAKYDIERALDMKNWQIRSMLLEMQTSLPESGLIKVDRSSMKYALEVRCPLLDYQLIEYSFRIPHKYKYYRGEKKYILKQMAYELIDEKLLKMEKRGFIAPLNVWLRGPLAEQVYMYADLSTIEKQGIFNAEPLLELIASEDKTGNTDNKNIVWAFLMFQMWYRHYIEDLW